MDMTRRRLEVLRQTYPGWRINVLGGRWWATRLKITPEQEALGLLPQFSREDGVALGRALSQQAGILHRHRIS